MWNRGAQHASRAQHAHALTPTRSLTAQPLRPNPPLANLTRQPGNFPGAQLLTRVRPPLRLGVLSHAALPSLLRRLSPAQISSASPGESKARGADPGLPAPPLRLCESRGRGRVRCGPALRAGAAAASVLLPGSSAGAGAEETRKQGGRERGRRGGKGGGRGQPGLWRGRARRRAP